MYDVKLSNSCGSFFMYQSALKIKLFKCYFFTYFFTSIEKDIFEEGSHILTNKKVRNIAFYVLIG